MSTAPTPSGRCTPANPLESVIALCQREPVTFAVFGASGDLAKKKIYPVLFQLFLNDVLHPETRFVGYARTEYTKETFVKTFDGFVKAAPGKEAALKAFWEKCEYVHGAYDTEEGVGALNRFIVQSLQSRGITVDNRIFYLALPATAFTGTTSAIRRACWSQAGWNRVIVEKPFGRDAASSAALSAHVASLFRECEVYRIDHYLGKEMVQNLFILRFANRVLPSVWNRENIQCIQITFKEDFGIHGRGGAYFDKFGIIRDIMQNHLLQVLSIVAMEKPVSTSAEDIRAEKIKALKSIRELTLEDAIVGQYVADPSVNKKDCEFGYRGDDGVPMDSRTPTFCTAVLYVRNERWDGVPFIMRAGKALNERKAEVRIQFRDVAGDIFGDVTRNELVMRIQPDEAVYLNLMNKRPGLPFATAQTHLDLTYAERYRGVVVPEAYERLLMDVVAGEQLHFVHSDELVQAWRIFTPLLHALEAQAVEPIPYAFGSRGPREAQARIRELGYKSPHHHL